MTLGDAAVEPLVHIKDFRMDFGDKTVIKDLSFDVRAGETFGLLGSNGSGKTTTLRALLGIYQPAAGTLHIGGKPFTPRDLSNSSTAASADAQKTASMSFTYTDDSGLIDGNIAAAMGGRTAGDPGVALQDVKKGLSDAYFAYPAEPAKQPVKVYGADKGMFENNKYDAVAKQLLTASAQAKVGSQQLTAAASGDVKTESQTFRDGQQAGGIGSVVPPLIFLLVFYVSIILLSNQMLSSTLEEKENRVTEMILTTLNPTTLIVGKVLALFMVGLVQILVFLTPIVVGYLFFRDKLALPDLDLSTLTFEPGTMLVGALSLLGGFTVFTASSSPSARSCRRSRTPAPSLVP